MKQFSIYFFLMVLAVAIPLNVPSTALASDGITWYSYEEGMALAKTNNKKVYINFHAEWCGYCHKMEKETFKDSKVISYLNQNFVPIRINSDKEKALARQYRVRGLPDNIFTTGAGENIGNQPGYLGPADFMKVMAFVYEEKYKSNSK